MGFFNTLSDNVKNLLTPNQQSRHELHGEGIKGYSESDLTEFREGLQETVDYAAEKTTSGSGKALGAAGTILAVGAGLALSEVILVGAAAYFIGKKMGEVGSRMFKEEASKNLNAGEFNRD